jgi:hypothetical protein
MNDRICSFLDRLDEALLLLTKEGDCFNLFHLGRSSLVMHHGFQLSTSDIDFVGMQNAELDQKALELFGKGTAMAEKLGLYLDFGPLSETVRQRLETWPAEQVTDLGRALLRAKSLAELGLED